MAMSSWNGIIGHAIILQLLDHWLRRPAIGYLFYGVSHVGKRTIAERCISRLLNEERVSLRSTHPDLLILEPEEGKTTISVERVRQLRGRVAERPLVAPRRVVYVSQADRLNEEGMNALLKILEEPPAETVFFFVSESLSKLPPTIQSRLVKVPFECVPLSVLIAGLKEHGYTDKEAEERARAARGRPGLALVPSEVSVAVHPIIERFFQLSTLGERLTLLESLTKQCESEEDVEAAWIEVLGIFGEVVRKQIFREPFLMVIFSQGIFTARRFVGGSLSPRFPLEAAILKMEELKEASPAEAADAALRLMPQPFSSSMPKILM